jgi:hypothetical protein
MNSRKLLFAVIIGGLIAQPYVHAQEVRSGFLKRTLLPTLRFLPVNPAAAYLCKTVAALRRIAPCPPVVNEPLLLRGFLPPLEVGAFLPHLRLNILLERMENKLVSGQGVAIDQSNPVQFLSATWKIQSNAATVQIPAPADDGFELPAPNPGEVWPVGEFANGLYQGIIINGCHPTTVFDVKLVSAILKNPGVVGPGDMLGQVQLQDAVVGNGFYVFLYTIRATEPGVGVSDFIFSGDARAFCTNQTSL